jgi:two-component system chemotaxis response regulator CheY
MPSVIIVADDSATARMVTKRCLEIAGYQDAEFLNARDGREALQLLRERFSGDCTGAKESEASSQNVELLVTDLNMPNMDGTSLLKHIKASPRFSNIPVLVISSMGNSAKEEELLKLGAFAVLSKPVSPASLMQALQNLENTAAGEVEHG